MCLSFGRTITNSNSVGRGAHRAARTADHPTTSHSCLRGVLVLVPDGSRQPCYGDAGQLVIRQWPPRRGAVRPEGALGRCVPHFASSNPERQSNVPRRLALVRDTLGSTRAFLIVRKLNGPPCGEEPGPPRMA